MGECRGLGCCCFHQSGKAVNWALSTSKFMANLDGCLVMWMEQGYFANINWE